MQSTRSSRRATWQRSLTAGLTLAFLLAGLAPALHHHEAEETVETQCRLSGLTTAAHFEPLEPEYHEPCALCAKTFSSARLEPPQMALVDSLAPLQVLEGPQILPPGPPGRNGASRAPPTA